MDNKIQLKEKDKCKYSCISLGEVMLRLDPGENRIRNARSFRVWEGGGEYNVTRGLKKCFGLETAVITSFAENETGKLLMDLIYQGGVNTEFINFREYDGVGKKVRNGINFTERGFGIRGALGVSDRGHSAASQMKPDEIDFDYIFGEKKSLWFHTGGIYAALSENAYKVALKAVETAKRYGTVVSYDLNYRPSLWKDMGGMEQARKINRQIAEHVDILIGNEEDFNACLGYETKNNDLESSLNIKGYEEMIRRVKKDYPNIKAIATTLRGVKTATINDWEAIALFDDRIYKSRKFSDLEILDRVGGGDSFACGLIYGILSGFDFQKSLDYGVIHGALAMTTPGDTSMADKNEVDKIYKGKSARVER